MQFNDANGAATKMSDKSRSRLPKRRILTPMLILEIFLISVL